MPMEQCLLLMEFDYLKGISRCSASDLNVGDMMLCEIHVVSIGCLVHELRRSTHTTHLQNHIESWADLEECEGLESRPSCIFFFFEE